MNAFLTGSQVYGTPTESSDIDLVVLVDTTTKSFLEKGNIPSRFGTLNLILLTNPLEFEAWKAATETCVSLAPVNRKVAAHLIDLEYAKRKLPIRTGVSG